MGSSARSYGRVVIAVAAIIGMLLASAVAWPPSAEAHPGGDKYGAEPIGVGVQVNSPEELTGFHEGVLWGDSGDLEGQTADLVYAGTGCTPASYAPVIDRIQGNIAIVDSRVSQTNPADQCPAFTFFQKVRSAQEAGAIGFIHIPAEGEEPRGNATAVDADIPAVEVVRTAGIIAVRDAVVAGETVNVTLDDYGKVVLDERLSDLECVDGQAGPFDCDGIDLLAFVPQEEFNGAGVSDLWGWTDPENGDEYVIIGKTNGVAFFRVTDPTDPVYLGELTNKAALHRIWHDIKVYEDHAIIVSESEPHGMKTFDLTKLRGVTEPQEWEEDAFYRLHSAAHNVEVNVETGMAYIVGGNQGLVVPDHCLSGLHMVDISDPKSPSFAGCYFAEGGPGTAARTVGDPVASNSPAAYVHDTQCVIYDGPDERYQGRELCFNSAEDKVVIADVTDRLNPTTVGVADYPDIGYTHQGWLTEDHSYFIVNDELDETTYEIPTRSLVFDVTDLENPEFTFAYGHRTSDGEPTRAITHNNYIVDGLIYHSNYTAGLYVHDVTRVADGVVEQVGYFDTFPSHSDPIFAGTWSNYPFFGSGTIAVSGIDEGLFLLRLQQDDDAIDGELGVELDCNDCRIRVPAGQDGTAELVVRNSGDETDTYELTVDELPEGWSATADPASVELAPGEEASVWVTVEVPADARKGPSTLTVVATSVTDGDVSAAKEIIVQVTGGPPADRGPQGDRGADGQASDGAADADLTRTAGAHSELPPAGLALVLGVLGVAVVRRVMSAVSPSGDG